MYSYTITMCSGITAASSVMRRKHLSIPSLLSPIWLRTVSNGVTLRKMLSYHEELNYKGDSVTIAGKQEMSGINSHAVPSFTPYNILLPPTLYFSSQETVYSEPFQACNTIRLHYYYCLLHTHSIYFSLLLTCFLSLSTTVRFTISLSS